MTIDDWWLTRGRYAFTVTNQRALDGAGGGPPVGADLTANFDSTVNGYGDDKMGGLGDREMGITPARVLLPHTANWSDQFFAIAWSSA